jgi:hypothetical protein
MGRKAKEAKKVEETGSLTSLFNATPKDPALEALFSLKNVMKSLHSLLIQLGWTITAPEASSGHP